uniref:Uncharacterized protein n=1 Tax=Arundo donax TaxID=35708 RepID=A0A0A8ZQX9_ARUDO
MLPGLVRYTVNNRTAPDTYAACSWTQRTRCTRKMQNGPISPLLGTYKQPLFVASAPIYLILLPLHFLWKVSCEFTCFSQSLSTAKIQEQVGS